MSIHHIQPNIRSYSYVMSLRTGWSIEWFRFVWIVECKSRGLFMVCTIYESIGSTNFIHIDELLLLSMDSGYFYFSLPSNIVRYSCHGPTIFDLSFFMDLLLHFQFSVLFLLLSFVFTSFKLNKNKNRFYLMIHQNYGIAFHIAKHIFSV